MQGTRLVGGLKFTKASELTGVEGECYSMQDLFTFKQTGLDGGWSGHSGRRGCGRTAWSSRRPRGRGVDGTVPPPADAAGPGVGPAVPDAGAWTVRPRYGDFIRQSGLPVSPVHLAVGSLTAAVLLAAPGGVLFGRVGGQDEVAAGGGVPYLVVATARRRRRERLIAQLATAFDQSGGQTLAGEFGPCLHQIELGIRPDDAFAHLGRGTRACWTAWPPSPATASDCGRRSTP